MKAGGFLAIWSDIARTEETDYLHWLTREHINERLDIPGFLSVRVYRAIREDPRYLIIYWLQNAAVVSSEAYVARLNSPTLWSQRTMRKLSNFRRGGGAVRFRSQHNAGGVVVPLLDPPQASINSLRTLAELDGITSISLLETDRAGTDIATTEKRVREREDSFERLLLVEALSEDYLASGLKPIERSLIPRSDMAVYRLVFSQLANAH